MIKFAKWLLLFALIVATIEILTTIPSPIIVTEANTLGRGLPTGRAATYVVASYEAPAHIKDQADYVCDRADDQVEIQAAIDAAPPRSLISLAGGDFSISDDITIPKSLTLEGYGGDNLTIIFLANNSNASMLVIGKRNSSEPIAVHIKGISFRGNKENQSQPSNQIEIWNRVRQSSFEDLFLYGSKGNNIFINTDAGQVGAQNLWFLNCAWEKADFHGMLVDSMGYNLNIITSYGGWNSNGYSAIHVNKLSDKLTIRDFWVLNTISSGAAIDVLGVRGVSISGTQIQGWAGGQGIYVHGTIATTITGNIIKSGGPSEIGPMRCVQYSNNDYLLISDNIFRGFTDRALEDGGGNTNVLIRDNIGAGE